MLTNKELEDIIIRSQHCQRNWNLENKISDADIKTMITSVTKCPSKQNEVYYRVTIVKNRNKIEKIYETTEGFKHSSDGKTILNFSQTNPQTLANILFIFSIDNSSIENIRSKEMLEYVETKIENENFKRNQYTSIGIASGYLTLTANLLGYNTGYCACFDLAIIENIIGQKSPKLIVGVGYKDNLRSRLEHHLDHTFKFPSFNKHINYNLI